ncbi:DNA-binding response regulator [Pseudoclavibacter endophyticus]|uniref:Response regulator transcription factor n=1 Tax=Pseudoclavibacter endophyticus TaxID=1778590 RepID=A0A6H9WC57_9MICO|nr:response regulator transcription factor [Pseudoclavibacter endophyticus]KAB1648250.1 response regulator transcription factor [Pseudoclavibacter endophyticus]GGA71007.1 DNA-binding response regulator [Pseudoclavibacter endophyticus]
MIRVAIADDHKLVRTGLGALLDAEPDVEVRALFANGQEAVDYVAEHDVDVLLMDIEMPVLDGVEATRRVLELRPETAVIVLTTFHDDAYLAGALRAGAFGYLLKTGSTEELSQGVRDAHEGRRAFAPEVLDRLAKQFADGDAAGRRGGPPARGEVPAPLAALTRRELDVFVEVGRGRSNREIAEALHLSEATVKTYVTRILAKLDVRSRVQLVVLAFETGIVTRAVG